MRNSLFVVIYFLTLALLGALLLSLPGAWGGPKPLAPIDALFTATSAVCVTGLISVDTGQYTLFGQGIVLFLIQMGGLGIITFATMLLILPGSRISFRNQKMVRNFYVEGVEHNPKKIVRNILLLTFGIEGAGALILFTRFQALPRGVFISLFHSVSAFCNAGFSTFSNSLESWNHDFLVLLTVAWLIIAGGLSFVVIHEVYDRIIGRRRRLTLHTRVVLMVTAFLILSGTLFFYLNEYWHALSSLSRPQKLLNAFFHAVTPRTAGFNSLSMRDLSPESRIVTLVFMFIGAAPGSMAGGIKVTTLFIILLALIRGIDEKGETIIFRKKISSPLISHAGLFFVKAFFLLCLAIFLLSLSERSLLREGGVEIFDLIFEAVSAFGTVGLSLGVTASLSSMGKGILIMTMLSGRIGLIFMASRRIKKHKERLIDYPHGEVLTG